MSKSKVTIPIHRLELYDKLIESHPDIELKGKTTPYTSLNGHMFSFLSKDGTMGLRLAKGDREQFLAKYKTVPMEQYGRTMKEYVVVPSSLLEDTKELSAYLRRSHDYVSTLKPKPTKT